MLAVGRKSVKLTQGRQLLSFPLPQGEPRPAAAFDGRTLTASCCDVSVELKIEQTEGGVRLYKQLGRWEHVFGLGTRAYPPDRRRGRFILFNNDLYAYQLGMDPLYASIPFMVFVEGGRGFGLIVNSPAYGIVDIGYTKYSEVSIYVEDKPELYILFGETPLDVYSTYSDVTGKPFLPPNWGLGLHISRYSYEPHNAVVEVVEEVIEAVPVDAVYLDIDYMDRYKQFTWDARKFPDPRGFVEQVHELGARVVAILDPYIKAEPGYKPFEKLLDCFLVTENDEIYLARGWPGLSALPDFLKPECREKWAALVAEFVSNYNIDGIWLDMNEPTVFNCDAVATKSRIYALAGATPHSLTKEELYCKAPRGAYHVVNGVKIPHEAVRGLYPYFEAMATYEGLLKAGKEPFILSRSGYLGIQKYAALWTGDVPSTWEGLRLTLMAVLGLSASGVPFVGADVGGFAGIGDYELIARWYQAAAFFPIYRVHRDKGTPDAEITRLPTKYQQMALEAVKMRLRFMPYLRHLAWEAHLTGKPIVRPLGLEFPDDEDAFKIYDEYMVGPYLLYAPIVDKGAQRREVYLPRGIWLELATGKTHIGPTWALSEADMPLYIRSKSAVPSQEGVLIFGGGKWVIYTDEGIVEVSREGDEVKITKAMPIFILSERLDEVVVNGVPRRGAYTRLGTYVEQGD
ncbi:alpha-glucosidase MalA [Pyrobaculum aerophilum]|uniref:Alpha-glucosidase n=2 Tax=Pyrobaculum aerophilum TaxID=13773 RepID=Q8ZW54_PYRAE|nr:MULTISPECIES: alpha-glucosidase MalA [Pyrobaculum]AAL63848.1 alpha-glucosidase [Pyrobaculum aerophilum str. IM2]MCX8136914.1 alpha-glucosidase MalA [Pyrobaculum aerophilum]HII46971.1 glycoside hydrolase family 31 protein [Pyrobaculum aerophilum]